MNGDEILALVQQRVRIARHRWLRIQQADADDLVQECAIVAMRAVLRHDPARKQIKGYVEQRVEGAILDWLRHKTQVKDHAGVRRPRPQLVSLQGATR